MATVAASVAVPVAPAVAAAVCFVMIREPSQNWDLVWHGLGVAILNLFIFCLKYPSCSQNLFAVFNKIR